MSVGLCVCSSYASGCGRCSATSRSRPAIELQNVGHRDTLLESLTAEEDNLHKCSRDGCWPGIDRVMESYYQHELGKSGGLWRNFGVKCEGSGNCVDRTITEDTLSKAAFWNEVKLSWFSWVD